MLKELFLVSLAGIALVWDCWKRKIPNPTIVLGFALGVGCQFAERGVAGLLYFLAGAMLPILLLWLLFLFRMLGAGDIKLLAVVGGFLGPAHIWDFLWATLLLAGVISLLLLLRRGNFISRFYYFYCYISEYIKTGKRVSYIQENQKEGQMIFALPVFLAVILQVGGYL